MLNFYIGAYLFTTYLVILGLALAQNISFSIVSRSRNRNNIKYHIFAAVFSNGIWFLTFRELVTRDMDYLLFIPYCIGTVTGSVYGVKISMWIEKKLRAESDSHIKEVTTFTGNCIIGDKVFSIKNGLITEVGSIKK